jgi:hypothetical protein
MNSLQIKTAVRFPWSLLMQLSTWTLANVRMDYGCFIIQNRILHRTIICADPITFMIHHDV